MDQETEMTGHGRRLLLLLCMLVYAVPVHAGTGRFESDQYHFTIAAQPDWVVSTALPQNDRDMRGFPTRYLLSEWQTWLDTDDRQTTEFTRIVYSPRNGVGVQDAAEISIDFHPAYEDLTLHYVRLQRDGVVVDRLAADRVRLIQHERDMDKHLYNGEVSALFVLDDVRAGDVIDYAYSIRGRNPVFAGKYFSSYALGWQVPVDRVAIRVVTSADRHLASRSYNASPAARERIEDGRRIYTWRLDNTVPLRSEGELPDWYDPFPWLQISEYSNWGEVRRWAESLYSAHDVLSAPLRRMIEEWGRGNGADSDVAIRKAVAFVQDKIRYFGVEMGSNSHMPSQPGETFARRYGDCKDKAVLLSAILTEMGYPTHPALVSMAHKRAIADWLPSPGVFDHVIVRSEINGRSYWIDATRTLQRGHLEQRGQPDFGRALVIGDESRSLARVTLPAGYRPTIDIEELYITDNYEGPAGFVVTSRYSYGEAEVRRRLFMNEPLDNIQQNYLNYYARIYPGIEVSASLAYEDDQENNVFTVTEHYHIPDYWEHRDGRLYSNFHGSGISDYTRLPDIISRKMPLALSYPLHVHHSAILQFPDDVGFANAVIDERIADAEMRFAVKSSYANRRLRLDYTYDSLTDAVMPEDMRAHLALRRQINDSLTFSAWVADEATLPQQTAYLPPQTVSTQP